MKKDVQSTYWDIFISHASEDKDAIARPLAQSLAAFGLKVWYDEYTLSTGDSLRRCIDEGLRKSKFAVVILSPTFFRKQWTERELNALFAKETLGGKAILPVWHRVTFAEVAQYSLMLADRLALSTDKGLEVVVSGILRAFARYGFEDTGSKPAAPDAETSRASLLAAIKATMNRVDDRMTRAKKERVDIASNRKIATEQMADSLLLMSIDEALQAHDFARAIDCAAKAKAQWPERTEFCDIIAFCEQQQKIEAGTPAGFANTPMFALDRKRCDPARIEADFNTNHPATERKALKNELRKKIDASVASDAEVGLNEILYFCSFADELKRLKSAGFIGKKSIQEIPRNEYNSALFVAVAGCRFIPSGDDKGHAVMGHLDRLAILHDGNGPVFSDLMDKYCGDTERLLNGSLIDSDAQLKLRAAYGAIVATPSLINACLWLGAVIRLKKTVAERSAKKSAIFGDAAIRLIKAATEAQRLRLAELDATLAAAVTRRGNSNGPNVGRRHSAPEAESPSAAFQPPSVPTPAVKKAGFLKWLFG